MKRYMLLGMFFLSGVVSLVGSEDLSEYDAELVKKKRKDKIEVCKNAMRDAESIIGQCHEMIKNKQQEYYENKLQFLQLELDENVALVKEHLFNQKLTLQDNVSDAEVERLVKWRIHYQLSWVVLTKIQLNALQNDRRDELKESTAYYDFCTKFVAFDPDNQNATCRTEGWYKETQSFLWPNKFTAHEDCSVRMSKQLFDILKLRTWSRQF